MDKKILLNVQQQSKRLIEQLNELEELKTELEPAEYELNRNQYYSSLKSETLEQLKTFQEKLLQIESGDLSLKTEIQKQQESITEAVKKSFNAEEIKKLMSSSQIQGIRTAIANTYSEYNLQRIDKNTFLKDVLNGINSLQDLLAPLTEEERSFLLDHTGKNNFVSLDSNTFGTKVMETAEQQLKQNLNK